VVSVLALAASTRASEYLAITDFTSSEEYVAAGSALSPSHSKQLLHGEVREMQNELLNLNVGQQQLEQDLTSQPMSAEQIDDKAVIWADEHPDQHKKIQFAFVLGITTGMVGLIILIASEIKTVLVVRELDREANTEEPKTYDLQVSEIRWGRGFASTVRLWFSLGGLCIMLAGALIVLVPLCDVLEDFGLPGAINNDDCITTVVVVAVISTIALSSLMVAIVWSCTRPWAALVLACISVTAQVRHQPPNRRAAPSSPHPPPHQRARRRNAVAGRRRAPPRARRRCGPRAAVRPHACARLRA
jgi:hypothetical protein